MTNWKFFLKYIFFKKHLFFFKNLKTTSTTALYLPSSHLLFTTLHFKLSAPFFMTQAVELFAYTSALCYKAKSPRARTVLSQTVVTYFFKNLFNKHNFFLFISSESDSTPAVSLTSLYGTFNWLERELKEMHGVFYLFKKDFRNLLLSYNENSTPLLKHYPSIGFKEIFYNFSSDLLIQVPVTLQF